MKLIITVQALRTALDFHLSVGVLRVNGGLDISEISGAHQKVMETSRQCSDTSEVSLDEESVRNNNSTVSFEEGAEASTSRRKDEGAKFR